MSEKVIRLLTVVFIVISILFLAIGLYCVGDVVSSTRIGGSIKVFVAVIITFCISYGALSFIIMALILRETYKLIGRNKEKK